MNSPEPVDFRGVIALELRDGDPPQYAALQAGAAGSLATQLGRDLAALVADVGECDLVLFAAHFDPAEALRPGWPLHRRLGELLHSAPGQAQGARLVGFGADSNGAVPQPLQCDPALLGGGLRILPFLLRGERAATAGAQLEAMLLDRGMAAADTALALQEGFGARIEHVRYLSLHDLTAMIAMQYANVGLQPLWTLLEHALLGPALLEPDAEAWLDAGQEPLARYADGEVRIALFDPCAWRARYASTENDVAKLERGFAMFQARQRQFAAVLDVHGVPVQFVHCAAPHDGAELRGSVKPTRF